MDKFFFMNRTGAHVHVRIVVDNSMPPRHLLIMNNLSQRTLMQTGTTQCFATSLIAKHLPELDAVAKGARLLVPQNHIPGSIIQRHRDHENDYIFVVTVLN